MCIRDSYLITIISLFMSCNDDNGQFIIDPNDYFSPASNEFIMATLPETGELVYWSSDRIIHDDIRLNLDNSETLDLTLGKATDTGFTFRTFRDISSGFIANSFARSEYPHPCYDNDLDNILSGKQLEVILEGTTELVEVINPLTNSLIFGDQGSNTEVINDVIYDYNRNVTIIRGKEFFALDIQFVFRFADEQEYKSIIIKKEDWVLGTGQKYNVELKREDLSNCQAHSIDVDIESEWIIDSEVLTNDDERIRIAKWSSYKENQSGNAINIFLDESIEMKKLSIQLSSNNTLNRYSLQKTFDVIPTSLELNTFTTEAADLTPESFTILNGGDYDLLESTYEYATDSSTSKWTVFQTNNSSLTYSLPTIIPEYLEKNAIVEPLLSNPTQFQLETYSTSIDINEVYSISNIDLQLHCLDYNSKLNTIVL